MKGILGTVIFLFFISACGGSGNKNGDSNKQGGTDITETPAYKKGLDLVAKNKCLTCHSVTETITGPPYQDIANKYAGLPDTIVAHLARKIISGGSGVWGEIFMTPHPDISQPDAEAMVKYILLLKK